MLLSDAIYLVLSESKKGLTLAELCKEVNKRDIVTHNGVLQEVSLSQVRRAVEKHPLLTSTKNKKPKLIRINTRAVDAREAYQREQLKMQAKETKEIKETKETNTTIDTEPLIAECYFCGYQFTIPNRQSPLLNDHCPQCGGFFLNLKGEIEYYGGTFKILNDPPLDQEYINSFPKKSRSRKKKTRGTQKQDRQSGTLQHMDEDSTSDFTEKTVTMKITTLIIIIAIVYMIAYYSAVE